jgi:hypothetical protein
MRFSNLTEDEQAYLKIAIAFFNKHEPKRKQILHINHKDKVLLLENTRSSNPFWKELSSIEEIDNLISRDKNY